MRILTLNLDEECVTEWAKSVNIPRHDSGYLMHAYMRNLFQDDAPQPFVVSIGDRFASVEGVMPESADMSSFTTNPDVVAVHAKEVDLPRAGETVAFRVRLCPVMRNGSSGKEVETDAFIVMLRRAEAAGQTQPKRMQVYRQWAAGRFADCLSVSKAYVERYEQIRPCRRGAPGHVGAPAAIGWRPVMDVSIVGTVTDAERFAHLARRGVGRHKAFGFGYIRIAGQ